MSGKNHGSSGVQWMETGIIVLMLGILLYNKSSRLAVPDSYGWLWASVAGTLSTVTKGFLFF
ncbi:MAG: hypothetical protein ACOZAM_19540 [Pseudomonadota bacterium]